MKKITFLLFLVTNFTLFGQNGKIAEVNGANIYYETYGQGEPLLLLHGFTVSHEVWSDLTAELSKNYKLIIPDLRGHGKSTNPGGNYTFPMAVNDMFGLMDHLNIDKFNALGQSHGAVLLTHMAIQNPDRISSLILAGGASYFPTSSVVALTDIQYDTMDPNWRTLMESYHPRGEEQIKTILANLRGLARDPLAINFTPPLLSTIACPTLIIHGDRDPFFAVDVPVISFKAIPKSYLWVVPNDGHFPAGLGLQNANSMWKDVLINVLTKFYNRDWN